MLACPLGHHHRIISCASNRVFVRARSVGSTVGTIDGAVVGAAVNAVGWVVAGLGALLGASVGGSVNGTLLGGLVKHTHGWKPMPFAMQACAPIDPSGHGHRTVTPGTQVCVGMCEGGSVGGSVGGPVGSRVGGTVGRCVGAREGVCMKQHINQGT